MQFLHSTEDKRRYACHMTHFSRFACRFCSAAVLSTFLWRRIFNAQRSNTYDFSTGALAAELEVPGTLLPRLNWVKWHWRPKLNKSHTDAAGDALFYTAHLLIKLFMIINASSDYKSHAFRGSAKKAVFTASVVVGTLAVS